MASSPAEVTIEAADEVSPALVEAFRRLLPQLAPAAPALTPRELDEIVRAPGTTLFVARDGGPARQIVGSATLLVFRIPSGRRARLESVVVDQAARGQGVGEALCRAALAAAEAAGAAVVDLTSAPDRAAANRLYERLGFRRRATNVYRFSLPAAR
jgi:ribosomal protein S18 acetylase RimI-like enzyme